MSTTSPQQRHRTVGVSVAGVMVGGGAPIVVRDGDEIAITAAARSFLHNQVRSMEIGRAHV